MADEAAGYRVETDTLGEVHVPAEAYWGAQTQRGLENFPVSGLRAHPVLIESFVQLKLAAAIVNTELAAIDGERGEAIQRACRTILDRLDDWLDQFVIDVFQAGAGTSLHMNVNEVIANLALERLGDGRGNYRRLSPNDHVNFGQSTNDTVPTAIHLTALKLGGRVVNLVETLAAAFEVKAEQFARVIKSGRTHLQDAVPITLGQEFRGYGSAIRQSAELIRQGLEPLREVCLGGSAVGTGLNTHREFREAAVEQLSRISGVALRPAGDPRRAMQSMLPVAHFHSTLRNLALELSRIANDLRLLASGPTTGLAEISLPAVQPGSSIMPGKVNPVMAECLNMVCFEIIGNDAAVGWGVGAGQLELNVMMPLLAHKVASSCQLLISFLPVFQGRCVAGISADAARCRRYFEGSVALATVLNPFIGYLAAADVAKEAQRTGKTIVQVVRERNLIDPDKLGELLDPRNAVGPLE